jgi:hypothetical protein
MNTITRMEEDVQVVKRQFISVGTATYFPWKAALHYYSPIAIVSKLQGSSKDLTIQSGIDLVVSGVSVHLTHSSLRKK